MKTNNKKMKNKHLVIGFIIAFALVIVGALLKIAHIATAKIVLVFAMCAQVSILVYLVVKNLSKKKEKFCDN
jgi:uncharacterized membrane protein